MLGDNWKIAQILQSNTEPPEEHDEELLVIFSV